MSINFQFLMGITDSIAEILAPNRLGSWQQRAEWAHSETIRVMRDRESTIASLTAEVDRLTGYSVRLNGLRERLEDSNALLTAERDALTDKLQLAVAHDDDSQLICLALRKERDALTLTLATHCHDWANDDTAIRNALRPILGAVVDGDSHGVPPLVDLVERVVAKGLEKEEAAANDLAWRAAVLTETCPTDEVHCGCVAILRQRIAALLNTIAELREELAQARNAASVAH